MRYNAARWRTSMKSLGIQYLSFKLSSTYIPQLYTIPSALNIQMNLLPFCFWADRAFFDSTDLLFLTVVFYAFIGKTIKKIKFFHIVAFALNSW